MAGAAGARGKVMLEERLEQVRVEERLEQLIYASRCPAHVSTIGGDDEGKETSGRRGDGDVACSGVLKSGEGAGGVEEGKDGADAMAEEEVERQEGREGEDSGEGEEEMDGDALQATISYYKRLQTSLGTCGAFLFFVHVSVKFVPVSVVREWERDTETQRHRDTETQRHRDRDGETAKETETESR